MLYQVLWTKGHKFGVYELATLGTFAMMDMDVETMVDEICEVDDYLKKQKGIGAFGISEKQLLMYATMLVMSVYSDETIHVQTATLANIISIIATQNAV